MPRKGWRVGAGRASCRGSGGPPLLPPLWPRGVGAGRPLLPQPAAQSAGAPPPGPPRAPLVTESAQQMRKWQAGWPWGLLFGLAPSEPSTTACLASTGESGPSTGGLSRARAPCLDGLAQPCPALPCPGCGRGCPEESGWEVPALWGWASPAASLLPLAPVCLHLGLPPPPPHLAPQSLTSPCPLLPFSLLFPSPFFCLSPFLFHLF